MLDGAWLYILRCADGSYHIGTTRATLEQRSRAKKEALIRGDFERLKLLAQRKRPHASKRPPSAGSTE
jgi:putative endonuclease